MAIDHSRLRMFLYLKQLYDFKGSVLTIGVQDIMAEHEDIEALFEKEKISYTPIPADERTFRKSKGQQIYQQFFKLENPMHMDDLFKMLDFSEVTSLDAFVNDNPTITHDLNTPIPREYHEKYDLIVDYGCLEHIFNVKQSIQNLVEMLKPNGVIFLYLPMLGWHNECFHNFQPPLFFDLFSANGFDEMRLFLNFFPKYFLRDKSRTRWVEYQYQDRTSFRKPFHCTHLLFIARKTKKKDVFITPLQEYYLKWFNKSTEENDDEDDQAKADHYMIENMPSIIVKLFPILIPIYRILPDNIRTIIVDTLIRIKNYRKLSQRKTLYL